RGEGRGKQGLGTQDSFLYPLEGYSGLSKAPKTRVADFPPARIYWSGHGRTVRRIENSRDDNQIIQKGDQSHEEIRIGGVVRLVHRELAGCCSRHAELLSNRRYQGPDLDGLGRGQGFRRPAYLAPDVLGRRAQVRCQ